MKLIIDIDESIYHRFINGFTNENDAYLIEQLFKNSTLYEDGSQSVWIPVSEELPKHNGVYNVTRIIEGTPIIDASYFDGQNTWHRDVCVNHGRPYLNDVIAWMPRPEPYKES